MKVRFTAKTNEKFTNGNIYSAQKIEELTNFAFFDVFGKTYRSDAFVRDFKILKEAVYKGADNSLFFKGRSYVFCKGDKSINVEVGATSFAVDIRFFNENFKLVIEESIKLVAEESIKDKKQYMIFVEGGQTSKKVHECPIVAEVEAKRLAGLSSNIGKNVSIVEIVKTFKAKVTIEEVENGR